MIMLASQHQDFRNVPLQTPYQVIFIPGESGFPQDIGPFNDPNFYNGQNGIPEENRILHINANNTIYRWSIPPEAGAINLSGGPTLSIVRIGE
jgi:hypothetical protein